MPGQRQSQIYESHHHYVVNVIIISFLSHLYDIYDFSGSWTQIGIEIVVGINDKVFETATPKEYPATGANEKPRRLSF